MKIIERDWQTGDLLVRFPSGCVKWIEEDEYGNLNVELEGVEYDRAREYAQQVQPEPSETNLGMPRICESD